MQISILLAHPNPQSFNHALARAVAAAAEASGHRVILRDLCAEKFDPILPFAEASEKNFPVPPEIARHGREAAEADALVFIHPNWWGQPPAILKGWLDRVLRPGEAYKFGVNAKGEAGPVGLLKARALLVLNTSNTPLDQERERYGDPLEGLWKRAIAGFLGIPVCERRNFAPVIASTPEDRARWLEEAAALARALFPRG